MRRSPALLLAPCLLIVLAACGGTDQSSTSATPVTSSASETVDPAVAAAADACAARPARYGDVLVRTKDPDLPWDVIELGGGWVFDHRTNVCRDSIDNSMSVIPTGPGYCGEVALASDNPGYDVEARPARALRKVLDSRGDCR